LQGLASGTNWVFRDESMHMSFAFSVIDIIRKEEKNLFDNDLKQKITSMLKEAVECELQFSDDLLRYGVVGLSQKDMRQYLQFVANQRCELLQVPNIYSVTKNPFSFMDLQDVMELTNFFERRVSSYQTEISGKVSFDLNF
jgi:ribonucleoside-diphosphate reductase beta chain